MVDYTWHGDQTNDSSLLINNNKGTKALTEIDEEFKNEINNNEIPDEQINLESSLK